MTWEILVLDESEGWFLDLTDAEQIDVQAMVDVLEIKGPNLDRPQADTIKGTKKVKNLKELVIQHAGNHLEFSMPLTPNDALFFYAVVTMMDRKINSFTNRWFR